MAYLQISDITFQFPFKRVQRLQTKENRGRSGVLLSLLQLQTGCCLAGQSVPYCGLPRCPFDHMQWIGLQPKKNRGRVTGDILTTWT